ncbi:hypothetical protein HDZ31DRAFT_70562 [Schizophyllum fasciatum]
MPDASTTLFVTGAGAATVSLVVSRTSVARDVLLALRARGLLPVLAACSPSLLFPSAGWLPIPLSSNLFELGVRDLSVLHLRFCTLGGGRKRLAEDASAEEAGPPSRKLGSAQPSSSGSTNAEQSAPLPPRLYGPRTRGLAKAQKEWVSRMCDAWFPGNVSSKDVVSLDASMQSLAEHFQLYAEHFPQQAGSSAEPPRPAKARPTRPTSSVQPPPARLYSEDVLYAVVSAPLHP